VQRKPIEVKRRRARFALPFDAHHFAVGHGRTNPRLLGQVGNVNEPLAAVRIAILAQIVA
jgi:hypothetical protein